MQHRLQAAVAQRILGRAQLEQVQAFQRPAVGGGHFAQLFGGLGQGDVQAALAPLQAFQQELQRQRGLARTRGPFQQVQTPLRKAAAKDLVQALDTSGDARSLGLHRFANFDAASLAIGAV
ncbi:hypothetical protein D3C72_1812220 [compost metagenome]